MAQVRDRFVPERFRKPPQEVPEPGRDQAEAAANVMMQKWLNDPQERQRIDQEFAIDQAAMLSAAMHRQAEYIDAIDRRITAYELRWMTAIRAIES
jgi:hypothetical protein